MYRYNIKNNIKGDKCSAFQLIYIHILGLYTYLIKKKGCVLMNNNKETILKYIQSLEKKIVYRDAQIKSLKKYRIIAFILSVFLMISTGINISLLIK